MEKIDRESVDVDRVYEKLDELVEWVNEHKKKMMMEKLEESSRELYPGAHECYNMRERINELIDAYNEIMKMMTGGEAVADAADDDK